jgi:hypothetical protein
VFWGGACYATFDYRIWENGISTAVDGHKEKTKPTYYSPHALHKSRSSGERRHSGVEVAPQFEQIGGAEELSVNLPCRNIGCCEVDGSYAMAYC